MKKQINLGKEHGDSNCIKLNIYMYACKSEYVLGIYH